MLYCTMLFVEVIINLICDISFITEHQNWRWMKEEKKVTEAGKEREEGGGGKKQQ